MKIYASFHPSIGRWQAGRTEIFGLVQHCLNQLEMVFNFESKVVDPPVRLFMGIDKYENEDLIKWGWPEDVWFHVDKVSSAHVYIRLKEGQTLDDIPQLLLEDAAQLCKANSIEGNKMNNIVIVYTMWSNLKKTQGMDVGQVGFHSEKEVRRIKVEKRTNEIVNRLNKTKSETHPDYRAEREERDRQENLASRKLQKEREKREKDELEKRKKDQELRSYNSLFSSEKMKTNKDMAAEDSDDFM